MNPQPLQDRAECRLVVECLRPPMVQDSGLVAELVSTDYLDIQQVLVWTVAHGASAFMARTLGSVSTAVPEPLRVGVEQRASAVRLRNLAHAAVLADVMSGLEESGIRALAFKGPALSAWLHGDLGIRPSNDLDILVAPDSMSRARHVLARLGFAPDPAGSRAFDAPASRVPLEFLRRGVKVELHSRLLPHDSRADRPFNELWTARVPVSVGPRTIHTLGAEDTALYLALHGFRHGFSCLKWLADLGMLLAAPAPPDWEKVLRAARAARRLRAVLHAFRVAAETLGLPLPPALAVASRDQGRTVAAQKPARLSSWFADRPMSRARRAAERVRFRLPGLRATEAFRELSSLLFRPSVEDWTVLPFLSPGVPLVFSIVRPIRLSAVLALPLLRGILGRVFGGGDAA